MRPVVVRAGLSKASRAPAAGKVTMKSPEGYDIPMAIACTTFVLDEAGQNIEVDKILKKLQVANRRLNTSVLTVWGRTQMDKGKIWTSAMDPKTLDVLK